MYQDIKCPDYSGIILKQLPKGVFLTVKAKTNTNTMIIGWGQLGTIWNRDVLIVYIRYSRYTYNLINEAKEFTVSVPVNADLKKEISFCGQYSGRDYDKFAECNLHPVQGRKIDSPIISECELHLECKVIYQHALEPGLLPEDVKNRYYKSNDYHVVYYGEIVDSYLYSK